MSGNGGMPEEVASTGRDVWGIRGNRPGSVPPMALMYHSVAPYEQDPYGITVSPARFERQMGWLRRRGLRGVSMSTLLDAWRAGRSRGLVGLTFDDGYADFLEYAVPVLAQYGFGATTFPVAGLLGGNNDWDPDGPRKPLMTEAQVRKVAEAGFEIGSHGMRHVSLPGTPAAAVAAEAAESMAILRAVSGQDVAGFCYPFGHVDAPAVDAVRAAGYAYGCGMGLTPETGVFAIPRTFVDDHDNCVHLIAKEVKHWLAWVTAGRTNEIGRKATRSLPVA
jgi:peptidoglycan/xylan/chitin deacetylase (PgdA/CDA1 family)